MIENVVDETIILQTRNLNYTLQYDAKVKQSGEGSFSFFFFLA